MGLKALIENTDGLDEAIATLYKQREDGKYALDVEGVVPEPDVVGIRENRDRTLKQNRELRDKLAKLEQIDPEEYEALRRARDEAEHERLEQKGEWDKLRQQLADRHQKELNSAKTREAMLMENLSRTLIDAEATRLLASEKYAGSATLLLPHIRGRAKVIEDGEGFVVTVLQKDGRTPMVIDGQGSAATLDDLISEMRSDPEFGTAFKATTATGSSAPPQGSTHQSTGEGATIKWGDTEAISANLADVASGKMRVVR